MEWFEALAGPEKFFYGVAILSSIFFVIKLALTFIGIGADGLDGVDAVDGIDAMDGVDALDGIDAVDAVDGVGVSEALAATDFMGGLRLFTVNGIMAFLSFGSWTGLFTYSACHIGWIGVVAGLIAGFIIMFLCAWIMRALMRMQSKGGAVKPKRAIGHIGEVYLRIPPKEQGRGKINVELNGGIREFEAVCLDEKPIEYGVRVRVVDIVEDDVMVVQRESEELE